MNDEIKEILDRIETASEIFDCLLKPEECTELINYITNLQNRITELEEINKQHQEINSELRTKIGKAVEYINKNKKVVSKYEAKDTRLPLGTFMWGVDNLLNILQDKEEV